MKLKYDFVVKEMGGEFSATTLEDGLFNGVIFLNQTGKDAFELLNNDITLNEMVEVLSSKYVAPKVHIKQQVESLIEILKNKNLLIGF